MTFARPLGRPTAEPSRTLRLPSKAPAAPVPHASHLKSSRISRLSAWNGMLRTRIFEVVCFPGTCFFRADVGAGLDGWGKGLGYVGCGQLLAYTDRLALPPRADALVLCAGEGFEELVRTRQR